MSLNANELMEHVNRINEDFHQLVCHMFYLMEYDVSDYDFCYARAQYLADTCDRFLEKYEEKLRNNTAVKEKRRKKMLNGVKRIGAHAQKVVEAIEVYGRLDAIIQYRDVKHGAQNVLNMRGPEFVADIETEVVDLMYEEETTDDESYDVVPIDECDDHEVDDFLEEYKSEQGS